MKHVNNEPLTNSALHWLYNQHTYRSSSIPYQVNEFHTYSAIWNESGVTFVLDDIPFWGRAFNISDNTIPIFQRDFFFVLNVAIGGNWPRNPDATTVFPASMEVDYVRVYNPVVPANVVDLSQASVRFYPISARNVLTVSFDAADGLRVNQVFNTSGQLVAKERGTDVLIRLQTSNWATGMYMIQVVSENEIGSYHVIVEYAFFSPK